MAVIGGNSGEGVGRKGDETGGWCVCTATQRSLVAVRHVYSWELGQRQVRCPWVYTTDARDTRVRCMEEEIWLGWEFR